MAEVLQLMPNLPSFPADYLHWRLTPPCRTNAPGKLVWGGEERVYSVRA